MSYPGIDYSLGKANVNTETGIHYGVISQCSIAPEAMDGFESDYGEPTCGECGMTLDSADYPHRRHPRRAECVSCEERIGSEHGHIYIGEGYEAVYSLIEESTFTREEWSADHDVCEGCGHLLGEHGEHGCMYRCHAGGKVVPHGPEYCECEREANATV